MAEDELTRAEKAFIDAFDAFATAHAENPEVAWPGKPYTENPKTGYFRPLFIPNTHRKIGIGPKGSRRHRGLFQVEVLRPHGEGTAKSAQWAADVAEYFDPETRKTLTESGVIVRLGPHPPDRSTPDVSGTMRVVNVTIPWWVDYTPA